MSDCNNSSFETILSEEVSYGIAHPSLDIKDTDCLKEVIKKLALKLEFLVENLCVSSESKTVNIAPEQNETVVDYSIRPSVSMTKGERGNTINVDWGGIILKDNDTLVQKYVNIYSQGIMIASTSKTAQAIELKPKDYPLDVEVTALVTTKQGTVRSSKIVQVSADEEKNYAPVLEIIKQTPIEDKNIAAINGELNTLRAEINEIKAKL